MRLTRFQDSFGVGSFPDILASDVFEGSTDLIECFVKICNVIFHTVGILLVMNVVSSHHLEELSKNDKNVMGDYMTGLHSPVRGLQDCQILPDFLGFEVFVGCCLELDHIILEII